MNALRNHLVGASRNGVTIVLALVFGFLGSQVATVFGARGDSGVINACVANRSGLIRVVDANAACRPNEYRIDWNLGGGGTPAGGITGLEVVWDSADTYGIPTKTVWCPKGKKALGGGARTLNPATIYVSRPVGVGITDPYWNNGVPTGVSGTSTYPAGWTAWYADSGQMLTVYVICADVAP